MQSEESFNGIYQSGYSRPKSGFDMNPLHTTQNDQKSNWNLLKRLLQFRTNRKVFPQDIKFISRGRNRKKRKKKYIPELQNIIDLKYQNTSLFFFSNRFPPRKLAIYIIENIWFKRFIIAMIFINCITMAIYDPSQEDSLRNSISYASDIFFQIVFTIELLLKIFAKGLILHKNSYLRRNWNILDAFIVLTGFLSILDGSIFTVLHTFKVLRPLRLVSEMSGMQVIVSAVARSIPMLLNASILYIVFLIIFGIAAVQLFGGKLRARCYHNLTGELYESTYLCGTQSCPESYSCLSISENPGFGNISYDNTLYSMLTLFASITRENWSFRMYDLGEVVYPALAYTFYIVLVLIGSFFIVNLNLVIISEGFNAQLKKENERIRNEQNMWREKILVDKSTADYSQDNFALAVEKLVQGGNSPITPSTDIDALNAFDQHTARSGDSLLTPDTNISLPIELTMEKKVSSTIVTASKRIRVLFTKESIYQALYQIYNSLSTFFDSIPYFTALRRIVDRFLNSQLVTGFFLFLIFVNTLVMGLDHYEMNPSFRDALRVSNYVFISLFTVEFALKIFGMGPKKFIQDGFNVFDVIVLAFSWIEVALPISSGFAVLRAFRLLRILKLAKFSKSVQKLLRIVLKSIRGAFMLTLLLSLLIFVYALLGMQLYGDIYKKNIDWQGEDPPRFNYDRLDWALITTFVIVSAENWPNIMYENLYVTGKVSVIYFASLYIIGNMLILNLFIGLLLSHFENDVEEHTEDEAQQSPHPSLKERLIRISFFWKPQQRKIKQSYNEALVTQIVDYQIKQSANHMTRELEKYRKEVREQNETFVIPEAKKRKYRSWFMDRLLGNYSLFIFGNSLPRRVLKRLVKNKYFDFVILFLIFLSSANMAMEDPFTPPDAFIMQLVTTVNLILTILFSIEAFLKIIAFGLLFMKGAYLRNPWNILDLVIVVVGVITQFYTNDIPAINVLRLIRTLRPLRIINRLAGLRIAVDALVMSIPAIINVLIFCGLNFIIFGIMGVNLFSGSFHICSNSQWTTYEQCVANGGAWESSTRFNFDNLPNSFLTLFVMSTMEGYPDFMLHGIDSRGPYLAPQEGSRTYMSLYFIAFIITGSLFMTNLFVGVLIDNYYTLKNKKHIGLLSPRQQEWVNMQRILYDAKPEFKPKPLYVEYFGVYKGNFFHPFGIQSLKISSKLVKVLVEPIFSFRRIIFRIAISRPFELLITSLILLNILVMSLDYYDIPSTFSLVLRILNYFFTAIFLIEACIKIIGFGVVQYFKDGWNRFDFLICVLSVLGILFSLLSIFPSGFTSLFRILRIGRAFRVFKMARGLRQLMRTLFISIPSLFNVSCLMFLFFFIFSILGTKLFAKVKLADGITSQVNFQSFIQSFVLLIRISTGEDFHELLDDVMVQPPQCSMKLGNCGNPTIAILFFCSFLLLAMFVLLNLFVAVILENFSVVINQEVSVVNTTTIQKFQACWRRYDPGLTLFIDANDLPSLILDVGEPLAFNPTAPNYNRKMRNLMRSLSDLNHHPNNMLHYQEVLLRLARYKFGADLPSVLESRVGSKWEKMIPKAKSTPAYTVDQIYAAMKMQQYWRQRMLMRKFAKISKKKQVPLHEAFQDDSDFSDLDSYKENDYYPDIYDEETLNLDSDNNSLSDDEQSVTDFIEERDATEIFTQKDFERTQ